MSAQDEIPPCRCIDHYPGLENGVECRSCRALGTLRITREELATMRAAVERRAELERLRACDAIGLTALSQENDELVARAGKAGAALASMTAEYAADVNASGEKSVKMQAQRDEARAAAETLRDEACHPTDPENPRRTLPWEVG